MARMALGPSCRQFARMAEDGPGAVEKVGKARMKAAGEPRVDRVCGPGSCDGSRKIDLPDTICGLLVF